MSILEYLPIIKETLDKEKIAILSAPTGSGKTTRVPVYLYLTGSRVFVVIPTRQGARGVYQRTLDYAEKNNKIRKEDIGIAVESEINYTSNQRLIFATAGHLRRKLLSYLEQRKDWDFTDILFLDEAHSGHLDYTLIFSFFLFAHKNNVKLPKLLLVSASPISFPLPAAKIVVPEVRKFKLDIKYIERKLPKNSMIYDRAAEKALEILSTTESGNILIFCPGKKEINYIKQKILSLLTPEKASKYLVLGVSSNSTKEEIKQVKEPSNLRKVVISTNMFEVSVTLDNLAFVIDTMLEKRSEESNSGGIRLVTSFISKSSAQQRAGRTGRVTDGICYRLTSQEHFEQLPEKIEDEVYRVPIYKEIVELYSHNLKPEEFFPEDLKEKIEKSLILLEKLELLQRKEKAQFVSRLTFGIRNSCFFFSWIEEAKYHPFKGLVVTALIDAYNPSYFWMRDDLADHKLLEDYKQVNFSRYYAKNEITSFFLLWNDFLEVNNYNLEKLSEATKVYFKSISINLKKFREVLKLIKDTIKRTSISPVEPLIETSPEFMNYLGRKFKEPYKDLILTRIKKEKYIDSNRRLYQLDEKNSINEKFFPYTLIALNSIEISGESNYVKRFVNLYLDIDELDKTKKIIKTKKKVLLEEYSLLQFLNKLLLKLSRIVKYYNKVTLRTLLESFFLAIANLKKPKIFGSKEDLEQILSFFDFQTETTSQQEDLLVIKEITRKEILDFLETPLTVKELRYKIEESLILVEEFNDFFEISRISKFLSLGSKEEVLRVYLRYQFLLNSGHFFSLPMAVFKFLSRNKFDIEGFSSPFNSNYLMLDKKFCSLFKDTDEVFGSLGSFFDQDFSGKRVIVNPPFVPEILKDTIEFMLMTLSKKRRSTFLFFSVYKEDYLFLEQLKTKEFVKNYQVLEKNKHYYEKIAERRKKKVADFNSIVYLLSNEEEELQKVFEEVLKLMSSLD
jgi:hypothetical protein